MSEHSAMWNIQVKELGTAVAFLFIFCSSFAAGIFLSPCSTDGVWDVPANEKSDFTCTAEGSVQWRLRTETSDPIAVYSEARWTSTKTFGGLFTPSAIDASQTVMTINPINNTSLYKNVQLVNGSLECVGSTHGKTQSSHCGLNFVYPPEEVSCRAAYMSWNVHVSCDIRRVYSSRRVYKCHLIRNKDGLLNQTLNESVDMVTSQTIEKITNNEVKVRGSCQFNTSLPAVEGSYTFYVLIFPGGRTFATAGKEFAITRPTSSAIACGPQPFVLENTDVTCSCSATSLGQPAGYLRWSKGGLKSHQRPTIITEQQDFTLRELQFTQTLSEADHNETWFRCDVVWGTEEIEGQLYTASVGFAARTPELSFNGKNEKQTVMEGERVQIVCKSEGRPTPDVSIRNNDNGLIWKYNSSPVIYTFVARCEDTATYECSALNEFSSQSGEITSLSLNLDVACKPRKASGTTHLGQVMFGNKTKEVNFDVIAYPVPSEYDVWLERPAVNSEHSYEKVNSSEMSVTCKADKQKLYLSRCTLTVFSMPPSSTGWYKAQITNYHGDENFTVVISHGKEDEEEKVQDKQLIVSGSVAAVVVFIIAIAVLIVVNRNRKKGG